MGETPKNRAERRARGRRIGTRAAGQAFRRPSARVRVHRAPFDPSPAQRPSSRLHGRTRYGAAREAALPAKLAALSASAGKLVPQLERAAGAVRGMGQALGAARLKAAGVAMAGSS